MEQKDKAAALEEMAAAIAHEIKNPLTMLKANIDIIEAAGKQNGVEKNYNMIHKELKKINDIMSDFIQLARKPSIDIDIVYVTDIILDLVQDIEISAPRTQIRLDYNNPDICIYGHEGSIRMLFSNILKNALEAMEFKGRIDISLAEANDNVKITFTDSGPGINVGTESKIYDEYFTSKPGGSGLGLSICRKIANEHNGSFALEQASGGGCIAIVVLPCYNGLATV